MTNEVHQLGAEAEHKLQDQSEVQQQQHSPILTLAAQGQMKRALIKYLSASKAKWTPTAPTKPHVAEKEDVEMTTETDPSLKKNSLPSFEDGSVSDLKKQHQDTAATVKKTTSAA